MGWGRPRRRTSRRGVREWVGINGCPQSIPPGRRSWFNSEDGHALTAGDLSTTALPQSILPTWRPPHGQRPYYSTPSLAAMWDSLRHTLIINARDTLGRCRWACREFPVGDTSDSTPKAPQQCECQPLRSHLPSPHFSDQNRQVEYEAMQRSEWTGTLAGIRLRGTGPAGSGRVLARAKK